MKKAAIIPFFLAFVLCVSLISPVFAEENYNWIQGGKPVTVGEGLATLDLSPELLYLNKEDTIKFEKSFGDTPSEKEIGSIFPADEKQQWAVFLEYDEVGYIKDEEKNKIDADEILNQYKEGTEEANKDKKPEEYLHVIGWDVAPAYDDKTHRLEWSMLGEDAQKNKLINYNVQMLTRKGYISFILVSDPAHLAQDKATLHSTILSKFKVNDGNRYEDFNEATDKVAEYGLTGLILGGLGLAVAKKAGLLALLLVFLKKGWVLILVVFGAILKFGKRLFSRNKQGDFDSDEQRPTA